MAETKIINGTLYEKVVDPNTMVLTGPEELFDMFNGFYIGLNGIEPTRDADGLPIIGTNVLDDVVWDAVAVIPTGTYQGQKVRDVLTLIPHSKWVEVL